MYSNYMSINTIKNKVKFYVNKAKGFLPEALPQGKEEFEKWSADLRTYFTLPTQDEDSIKFMLGSMMMHLGPQEHRKPKYFFVKSIRAAAAKQVGAAAFSEVKQKQMAAQAAAANVEATTNPKVVDIGQQK